MRAKQISCKDLGVSFFRLIWRREKAVQRSFGSRGNSSGRVVPWGVWNGDGELYSLQLSKTWAKKKHGAHTGLGAFFIYVQLPSFSDLGLKREQDTWDCRTSFLYVHKPVCEQMPSPWHSHWFWSITKPWTWTFTLFFFLSFQWPQHL